MPCAVLYATGSPIYLCPEVWHSGTCSHKSDVWSLGCVLYQLMALSPPFAGGTGLVQNVLYKEPAPLPAVYNQGLRDAVADMLQKDPEARPSCRELRRTAYIEKGIVIWMRVSCNATVVPLEWLDSASFLNDPNYLDDAANWR